MQRRHAILNTALARGRSPNSRKTRFSRVGTGSGPQASFGVTGYRVADSIGRGTDSDIRSQDRDRSHGRSAGSPGMTLNDGDLATDQRDHGPLGEARSGGDKGASGVTVIPQCAANRARKRRRRPRSSNR